MTTQTARYNVTTIEARTRRGLATSLVFGTGPTPGTPGVFAEVTVPDNAGRMEFSRLAGERVWTLDAMFGPGGFPIFANGYGARFLITEKAEGTLADVLDAAADEAGL